MKRRKSKGKIYHYEIVKEEQYLIVATKKTEIMAIYFSLKEKVVFVLDLRM